MNLPCRYSQAKSSLHRPCPSGRTWLPELLALWTTPRPRRLIPRMRGPRRDAAARGSWHTTPFYRG